jgi:hypothetical protein
MYRRRAGETEHLHPGFVVGGVDDAVLYRRTGTLLAG